MSRNARPDVPEPLLEDAADWLDRQAELDAAGRAAFRAWIAVPLHALAYDMVRHAMLDSALLAAMREADAAPPLPRRLPRARALGWAAAGLTAAAILVLLFVRAPLPAPAAHAPQDYATRLGQRADWRLADNSHLYLNADSRVTVVYRPDARDLSLMRGEAIFEVAKNPKRPFHVAAHAVTVTAVGTRFGVDLMNDAVGVRVYHGVVTVAQTGAPLRTLRRGDWLTLDPARGAESGHFDPATYESWRDDWLEADKMPLPYVVAKLNRYAAAPIVIGDAALKGAVLTGRFRLSTTAATVKLIAAVLGATPERKGGRIYLVARRG